MGSMNLLASHFSLARLGYVPILCVDPSRVTGRDTRDRLMVGSFSMKRLRSWLHFPTVAAASTGDRTSWLFEHGTLSSQFKRGEWKCRISGF
jgi:hypothetical protein